MRYILFLTTFTTSMAVVAQQPEDYSLKHSMKQDGLAMSFTVLDPDKKGIRHYEDTKTYFWYKAQHVIGTQGGSSGQLLHGAFESFYGNKQLCEKGLYVKGLKDGEWNYWRADGTLIRIEHWKNGTQRGLQIDYSEKGTIRKRTVIRGRHTTTQTGDSLVEISGKSQTITIKDSLGQLVSVARYNNGLLHGKQETYAADGSRSVTAYKKGVLVEKKVKESTTKGKKETENPAAEKEQVQKKPFAERLRNLFRKKDKTSGTEQTETPGTKKKRRNPFKRKAE